MHGEDAPPGPRPLPASGPIKCGPKTSCSMSARTRVLKCLTVVDEYTREALAIDVAGRIRSTHVIEVLARLINVHGAPAILRSDYGPEFVSRAVLRCLLANGIDTAHIGPENPWENGVATAIRSGRTRAWGIAPRTSSRSRTDHQHPRRAVQRASSEDRSEEVRQVKTRSPAIPVRFTRGFPGQRGIEA